MDSITDKVILTIDDESYIRQSIKAYFEDFSFAIFETKNGKKGIEICNSNKIDSILLDLKMSGITGIELTKEMNKINKTIPSILCSGYAEAVDLTEIDIAGISKFFKNPLSMDGLSSVIQNILQ